nr:unnamed protein product [Digitaria exilis]
MWVHLENGVRQYIEDALKPDYVVTADDVGTLLAIDCTPFDDNGRHGDLVTEFANSGNKITCDPEMQSHIDACISSGRAEFQVFLLTKIPNGRTTQFSVVSYTGANLFFTTKGLSESNLTFTTKGLSESNNEDYDVRLRDLIVLVIRTFQKKAIDAKRKGKAM